MPIVTPEQIRDAKKVDLLTYLQKNEPWELKKSSSSEYRMASHGSLVLSNGLWFWNKAGFGGRSALDFLVKVRGMDFVNAVETVLSGPPSPISSLPQPENVSVSHACKKLYLPKRTSVPHKLVKYLGSRGIHPDVIGQCLKAGTLYEGVYKNPKKSAVDSVPVCVFVGYDETSTARFAALRGITVNIKRDAAGSDKAFGFVLSAGFSRSRTLAVFEAPIDLLSHATLTRLGYIDFTGDRLSLGGTSDVALIAYLKRNPDIEYISLCLDNDGAGKKAAQNISTALANSQFKHITVKINLPKVGKDYNDSLLQSINLEKECRKNSLQRKAVFL